MPSCARRLSTKREAIARVQLATDLAGPYALVRKVCWTILGWKLGKRKRLNSALPACPRWASQMAVCRRFRQEPRPPGGFVAGRPTCAGRPRVASCRGAHRLEPCGNEQPVAHRLPAELGVPRHRAAIVRSAPKLPGAQHMATCTRCLSAPHPTAVAVHTPAKSHHATHARGRRRICPAESITP